MPRKDIARYLNPWMFKREQKRLRFEALRQRDGDKCWRCRRSMGFDLPPGHDQAPTIEHRTPKSKGGTGELDNLCLCHGRCNRLMGDATAEVKERMRLKNAAAQLAMEQPRRKMRA
jgi:5-methylcytosine-specific restriction endonuclease McrA